MSDGLLGAYEFINRFRLEKNGVFGFPDVSCMVSRFHFTISQVMS